MSGKELPLTVAQLPDEWDARANRLLREEPYPGFAGEAEQLCRLAGELRRALRNAEQSEDDGSLEAICRHCGVSRGRHNSAPGEPLHRFEIERRRDIKQAQDEPKVMLRYHCRVLLSILEEPTATKFEVDAAKRQIAKIIYND